MTTASKPSKTASDSWTGRRVDFGEFSKQLASRREALGDIPTPRNSGTRRTASKRALLKAIEDAGGKW